ncbi:MAG: hypothetical protein VYC81_08620, partial [Actinomycetota bacterium]|nr:hypothetical protein [Actinomycetota bacterium]
FEHNIPSGQPALQIAQELLQQIVNRLGVAAQETVDVRIETGEAGDVSLVLQSSAGPIEADIDFESSIQGQSGTQQINTVALPDAELDPGETLELTLTVNTPTGTQTVTLQQTLDLDETLQDAAQGLVADLATLEDDQGNPLGLSGELVTVTSGAPGTTGGTPVPSIQITAQQGSNLNQVQLSVGGDVETTESTVETSAFVSTLEIPTDAEIATLPANAELEVEIEGGDLDAAVTLTVSTSGFSSATALASQLQSQLLSEITAQHPESQISVTVDTAAATSTSGVSLVLQSSAGPITTDIDFETTSFSTTGSQSFASVDLPSEISQGDELGLEVTGSGAAVNLTQTVADGETIEQVADRLVADLVSTSAGDLSAEVVTVDDGSGGVRTTLQITSANGTTPQVELELRSDVETTESTVETSAFVSTVEIPTDVGELSQSAQLDVNISGDGFPAIQFEHNIPSGQPALQIAQELLQQIVNRLGVAAQETVDVRIETGE